MNGHSVRLLRSGGIKAATTGVVALLGLAASAVLARSLDQTALGGFALILAMVQIGTMLADGGTGLATTRFIAATMDGREQGQALASGIRARLLTTAFALVVGAVLMRWLQNVLYHGSVTTDAYVWALAWIVTKSLFLFAPAVARGRMSWAVEGGLLVLESLAILFVYASLHWWPGGQNDLPLRLALAYLLLLAPAQACLRIPATPAATPGVAVTVRRLLRFGLPLVMNSSIFLLLTWTDRIMIGVMSSPGDLAVYFIAANLAGAGRMLFSIPEQVLYSHLAAHVRAGDPGLPRIHEQLFRLFASLGALFVVAAGALGIMVIPLIYGDTYTASIWPFQLLLVVLLVRVVSIPASLLLIGVYERTAETRDALALAFLVNVLVNLLLIPRIGLVGAILGSLLAFATTTGYLWLSLWRVARLRPGAMDLITFLLPTALWLAVVAAAHAERIAPWLAWSAQAALTGGLTVVASRQVTRIGLLAGGKAAVS